jgi:Pyridoxamine 5'-phosphate oxidase
VSGVGALAGEKYISLTTFKQDGTPVATPVWVESDDGRRLLVWTALRRGKSSGYGGTLAFSSPRLTFVAERAASLTREWGGSSTFRKEPLSNRCSIGSTA